MRRKVKYIFLAAVCILSAVGLSACAEEVSESENALYTGYWNDTAEARLIKFEDGEAHSYKYVYEESEGKYYGCYYPSSARKYLLDVRNSLICFLPDTWYDIYVLTDDNLTLGDGEGGTLRMAKIRDKNVTVLSEKSFNRKYPDYDQGEVIANASHLQEL